MLRSIPPELANSGAVLRVGRRALEHEPVDAMRMTNGDLDRYLRSDGAAEQHRPLDADGVHPRDQLLGLLVHRRSGRPGRSCRRLGLPEAGQVRRQHAVAQRAEPPAERRHVAARQPNSVHEHDRGSTGSLPHTRAWTSTPSDGTAVLTLVASVCSAAPSLRAGLGWFMSLLAVAVSGGRTRSKTTGTRRSGAARCDPRRRGRHPASVAVACTEYRPQVLAEPRTSAQDPARRAAVMTASPGPFRGYATALRTSLPDAVRVLDALHVVRLGQAAVDDAGRRGQQTLGRRGRGEGIPPVPRRRLLRRGFLTVNQRQWSRLELTLSVGGPSGHLTQGWGRAGAAAALRPQPRLADARHRLWRVLHRSARSDVPELLRLARTLDA